MDKHELDKFKGVIVAMYACYNKQGAIHPAGVKALARHYCNLGIKGLYVGGSSGEGMLQSVEERKRTLEAVMEEVGGELTVIAHVGAPSTGDSVQLTKHAEQMNVDAASAVPCIYYPLSPQAVEAHWQAIIDSTALPFIMYHIPQTTGFQLSTTLLEKMAVQDKVIGVKVSSDNPIELQQFKAAGGRDFLVFSGADGQYLASRSMGADGGIGGSFGVMPELFMKIDRCFREGRMDEALYWQCQVNAMRVGLFSFSSIYGAFKGILRLRGIETGDPRLPLLPVGASDLGRLAKLNEKMMACISASANNMTGGADVTVMEDRDDGKARSC